MGHKNHFALCLFVSNNHIFPLIISLKFNILFGFTVFKKVIRNKTARISGQRTKCSDSFYRTNKTLVRKLMKEYEKIRIVKKKSMYFLTRFL